METHYNTNNNNKNMNNNERRNVIYYQQSTMRSIAIKQSQGDSCNKKSNNHNDMKILAIPILITQQCVNNNDTKQNDNDITNNKML